MQSPGPSRGQIHASCAARPLPREAAGLAPGVLILGEPGAGKSDLLLRLLDHGFMLVADDRVEVAGNIARAPASLAGLLEVRGLGIVYLPFLPEARLRLVVHLAAGAVRLPEPGCDSRFGVPSVTIDPAMPSAPARVALALACALGEVRQLAGAFAA